MFLAFVYNINLEFKISYLLVFIQLRKSLIILHFQIFVLVFPHTVNDTIFL